MADTATTDFSDYIPTSVPQNSSSKPTDLDEQKDEEKRAPPYLNATPDEGGIALQKTSEQVQGGDLSASEFGMSLLSNTNAVDLAQSEDGVEGKEIEGTDDLPKANEIKPSSNTVSSSVANNGDCNQDINSEVSLTASKTKPKPAHGWIDVLGNGNLLKRVLRDGEGMSTRPTAQTLVRMKVRGSLSSGGVVDRHSALEFIVGDGDVIQALDIIAPLMEKGETCQIKTDHRYAYGAVGRSPDIPPNSALVYDLELVDVKRPIDYSSITEKEFLHFLNKKRGRGNDLFQRKEFSLAVHSYSRAVTMMTRYKEEQSLAEFSPEISDLWVRCLNNLAAAQLKVEMYNEALESVGKVLDTDPENVKALYRCGKVHLVKGEYKEAVQYLQKASNLSPDEKAIQAELQKALRKRDQSLEQEKALYKRMMAGGDKSHTSQKQSSNSPPNNVSGSSWSWKHVLVGAGLVAVTAITIGYLAKYRK